MKFDLRILFLITSIASLLYVINIFYEGTEYDGNFWIAVIWIFMGIYLYKYPWRGKEANKE